MNIQIKSPICFFDPESPQSTFSGVMFVSLFKDTSYIEDIALLLRETGECLISLATRPNISREILANCGVLVSFLLKKLKILGFKMELVIHRI